MINLSKFSSRDFDRGASRGKEMAWVIFRSIFFCHSLPLPSALKVALLRAFGAEVGRGVVIRSHVNVSFPWRLTIGDHVWLGDNVSILSLAPVIIGSHVCISQRTFICTGSHDYLDEAFALKVQPVRIEDHCWIAANCFIAPGVVIGRGSVAAAGSIVTRNVAANTVVGGNPAHVVRAIDRMD